MSGALYAPTQADRARWADELARAEEEIDALAERLKDETKATRGMIAEKRKRARLLVRYIAGREVEPMALPFATVAANEGAPGRDAARAASEVAAPCEAEWMAKGGWHVYTAGKCVKCGRAEVRT